MQMDQIKKLKFIDHHKFKPKENEDRCTLIAKLRRPSAVPSQQQRSLNSLAERVKSGLEEGEKLINDREKLILFADNCQSLDGLPFKNTSSKQRFRQLIGE